MKVMFGAKWKQDNTSFLQSRFFSGFETELMYDVRDFNDDEHVPDPTYGYDDGVIYKSGTRIFKASQTDEFLKYNRLPVCAMVITALEKLFFDYSGDMSLFKLPFLPGSLFVDSGCLDDEPQTQQQRMIAKRMCYHAFKHEDEAYIDKKHYLQDYGEMISFIHPEDDYKKSKRLVEKFAVHPNDREYKAMLHKLERIRYFESERDDKTKADRNEHGKVKFSSLRLPLQYTSALIKTVPPVTERYGHNINNSVRRAFRLSNDFLLAGINPSCFLTLHGGLSTGIVPHVLQQRMGLEKPVLAEKILPIPDEVSMSGRKMDIVY